MGTFRARSDYAFVCLWRDGANLDDRRVAAPNGGGELVEFGFPLGFADAAVDFGLKRLIAHSIAKCIDAVGCVICRAVAVALQLGPGACQHIALIVLKIRGHMRRGRWQELCLRG